MKRYLVSYDLRNAGRNYRPLYNYLNRIGVRALESVWLVHSPYSASVIRDTLRLILDSDDGVLVLELKTGVDWASFGLTTTPNSWLHQLAA